MKSKPIGIFDSGVGGLTILKQLYTHFPNESFIYVGDSARAPYGEKTPEELYTINKEIICFLLKNHIKALVMACNTSCAQLLPKIRKEFSLPIIDLIAPAAEAAVKATNNNKIAILATTRTISLHAYKKAIHKLNPAIQVLEVACPKLVPLVEQGNIYSDQSFRIANAYFQEVLKFGADTLVFGCSHYPYFENVFNKLTSKSLNYIDPAITQISQIKPALDPAKTSTQGTTDYWVSGDKKIFQNFLTRYLQKPNQTINTYPA
jgi:glutamate racemase